MIGTLALALLAASPLAAVAALPGGGSSACGGTGTAPDPLHATRAGRDVHVWWTSDPGASGYDVYRVDAKGRLADLTAEPVYVAVSGPAPALPLVDVDAVPVTPGLLFYQVVARCASCVPGRDRDGDRLEDCIESGSLVFNGPGDPGTDPDRPDTDGDAIPDGDETLGTLLGLDLPGLGANPLRLDVFIEYDWFEHSNGCGNHSHQPTPAVADRVTQTFALAPLTNPDGSSGIAVHQDFGQGGVFTGGNLIDDADGVLSFGVNSMEFLDLKDDNLDDRRQDYFHYVILPHNYNVNSGSSGQAEINGNDLIVSLQCSTSVRNIANTIVHEIGHNFGLLHGGQDGCNYKPNYNSVMNYRFQFAGYDDDCDATGDGLADYGRGQRIDLDETDLDENAGTCGTVPIDWDGDRRIEASVSDDLNNGSNGGCGGDLSVLRDYEDWPTLNFAPIVTSDFHGLPVVVIDCDNPVPAD